jgi:hypothetical protein
MLNNWHKKEKPIQGMMGVGGGATGYLVGGGSSSIESSGGLVNDYGGYRYHIFNYPNSDNFVAGDDISGMNIDLLLVAGGGAGGSYYGAGGGAGGLVRWTACPVTTGNTYPITVGQGGSTAAPGTTAGGGGYDSYFNNTAYGNIRAMGGGGGQPAGNPGSLGPLGDGGSGGGSGSVPGSRYGGTGLQPTLNPLAQPRPGFNQYGNPGGNYLVGATGYAPAGGGGAGGNGASGYQSSGAANGGTGQAMPGFPYQAIPPLGPVGPRMGGSGHTYAGGGSSGGYSAGGNPEIPGGGGAGHPKPGSNNYQGANGLGGGGGGRHPSSNNSIPTAGGHGICVIRYQVV